MEIKNNLKKQEELKQFAVNNLTKDDIPYISWSGTPLYIKMVGSFLELPPNNKAEYIVVRTPEGVPASMGKIEYNTEKNSATISQIVTNGKMRGKGLATKLISEMEKRIIQRGLSMVQLGVEKKNSRAMDLYLHLGYQTYGEGKDSWKQEDKNGNVKTYHAELFLMNKELTV